MTSAPVAESVVRECAAAGVKRVWLYRAVGRGAVSEPAVQACKDAGIDVVIGECPFMFLPEPEFPHNLHVLIKRITFTYPR
jgi:predicted CoA-binding protein